MRGRGCDEELANLGTGHQMSLVEHGWLAEQRGYDAGDVDPSSGYVQADLLGGTIVYMKTVVDLDEDLLDRARRELGTTTKKETIHEALRLVAERSARLQAIQELLSIDRDWTGIVDDDKVPAAEQDAA